MTGGCEGERLQLFLRHPPIWSNFAASVGMLAGSRRPIAHEFACHSAGATAGLLLGH